MATIPARARSLYFGVMPAQLAAAGASGAPYDVRTTFAGTPFAAGVTTNMVA
jgi:hypothetical protein